MKIAQIAPPWLPIPPSGYGGVENVVAALTDGLVERGHDVTLFASGGSGTRARLRASHAEPLGTSCQVEQPLRGLPPLLAAYAAIDEFDVVHDHAFPFGPLLGSRRRRPSVVHTVHTAPSAPHAAPIYEFVHRRLPLVAVSGAQARSCPHLQFAATISNGIPVADFAPSDAKDDYLLFLGRMSPAKGVHLAVEAAAVLGRPLLIAAKMRNPEEIAYFESRVEPLLGPDAVFLGEVDRTQKMALLRRAACTLVPTRWEEPFGLVMTESLACGTPVVALRAAAAEEIVDHGVTGYLARDFDEFVRLIPRVSALDPAACRAAADDRFAAARMVEAYERLYLDLCR
jgi:glycosyltransferase involved in cell wall biosynthesis